MRRFRAPTREQAGVLIAIVAIMFGGWVRLFPPSIAGFPINDGGLFVAMIQALQMNGLKLPVYFQYNGRMIPFAYPPIAFYVGALASDLSHLSAVDIVRWLPALVLVVTIPAFYYLAKSILKSSFVAGLATLAYAFTPRTMTWTIMGGGLTRSLGLLFLLLSLASIYRLYEEHSRRFLVPSILFSTLVILAHPEAALHTIVFTTLFWVFKGRTRQSALNSVFVAAGAMLASGLWWIPALIRMGPNPFLAAAQTGSQSSLSILYPFLLTLTDEPFLTLIAVLGLVGCVLCIARKNYFLPLFYFVPFIVDPRSSATYAMIPLAMMAGLAMGDLLLPAVAQLDGQGYSPPGANPLERGSVLLLLTLFGLYFLGGAMYFGTQVAATAVSAANRTAFEWVASHTPPGSRFLVMTGENEILCDGVQEWFPVLTQRISILTIQGDEWLPGKKYIQAVSLQGTVQACLSGAAPLGCIDNSNLEYDYLYVARLSTLKNLCRAVAPVMRGEGLIADLEQSAKYRLLYKTDAVAIYSYQR